MDRSHWMKDLWDQIKVRKPWQILLPGTHNSGIYSALNTVWVRNQDMDIGAQLNAGIRWFDLRVTKAPPPVLTFHHSGYFPPSSEQAVLGAFEQIHNFAQANDHEVFALNLCAGYGSTLRAEDAAELRNTAIDWFQEWLVPADFWPDCTLENIVNAGKRIIVLSGLAPDPDPQKAGLMWDNRGGQYSWTTWDGYQSGGKHTLDERLAFIRNRVSTSLAQRVQARDSRFFCADCMAYEGAAGTSCAPTVNSHVGTWIDAWSKDISINFAMNVFSVDFFEQGADIVGKLLELNQNLPPIPYWAGPTKSALSPQPMPSDQGLLERRELPHFRGDDSFMEQCADKTLAGLELNYDKYKQEYLTKGSLGEDSMAELSAKIPSEMVSEYLKWLQAVVVDRNKAQTG